MFDISGPDLGLAPLAEHVEREFVALKAVEIASLIQPDKLDLWFHYEINLQTPYGSFLKQLCRDNNHVAGLKSLRKLIEIYNDLANVSMPNENAHNTACVEQVDIRSAIAGYILLHDLLKPLNPLEHDKLISDFMSTFGDKYKIWERFKIDKRTHEFILFALLYHHLNGTTIIGEQNYLIYEMLFSDAYFKCLPQETRRVILRFLTLHAALDSSAIDEGYLARTKLERYFRVVEDVEHTSTLEQAKQRTELRKVSQKRTRQRIEWLLSSYDPRLDSRDEDFYVTMFNSRKITSLEDGLSKLRRIIYSAKFFYSVAHRIVDPGKDHIIDNELKGGDYFFQILSDIAERSSVSSQPIVEIHFEKKLQTPSYMTKVFEQIIRVEGKFRMILFAAESEIEGEVEIIRVYFDKYLSSNQTSRAM